MNESFYVKKLIIVIEIELIIIKKFVEYLLLKMREITAI